MTDSRRITEDIYLIYKILNIQNTLLLTLLSVAYMTCIQSAMREDTLSD